MFKIILGDSKMKYFFVFKLLFILTLSTASANNSKLSAFLPGSENLHFLKGFVSEHTESTSEYKLLKGKVKKKDISIFKYKDKKKGIDIVLKDFIIQDVFPLLKDITLINNTSVEKINIFNNITTATLLANNKELQIIKSKKNNNSIFIYFDELLASSFIPYTKATLLDKVSLHDIMFIVQKKSTALKYSDLPSSLQKKINEKNKNFFLGEGLNILSSIDFKTSEGFKEVLNTFSMKETSFPLQGVLSKDSFKNFHFKNSKKKKKTQKKKKLSEKEKKSLLRSLSLNISLPELKFKRFDSFLSSENKSVMKIQSKEEKKKSLFWKNSLNFSSSKKTKDNSSSLSLDLSFPLKLNLNGFTQKLKSNIEFSTGENKSISIISLQENIWKSPLNLKTLNINKGAFKIDLKQSKNMSMDFFGSADYKKLKNTLVDISFSKKKNAFEIDKIDLKNNFKLSSLLDGNYLSFFDKFEIEHVKQTSEELLISGHLNKKAVSFTRYKNKKEVIVALEDFTVSDIFPKASSIPKLNNFALQEFIMYEKTLEAHILLNDKKVKIIKEKDSSDDDALAVYFSSIKSSNFVPSISNSLADNLSLNNVLFLLMNKNKEVKIADLPGSLKEDMKTYAHPKIELFEGINILANLDLKTSDDIASVLEVFGLNSTTLPLKGTLSKETFKLFSFSGSSHKTSKDKKTKKQKKDKLNKEEKKSILSNMSLSISLPKISLPKFAANFDIEGPSSFNIKGKSKVGSFWDSYSKSSSSQANSNEDSIIKNNKEVNPSSSSGLSFSMDMNVRLNAFSLKEIMPAKISFSGGKDKSFTLVSVKDTSWKSPFDIPGLSINKGAFIMDLNKGASSEIGFFGFSDFASKKDIFMSLNMSSKEGKLSLKNLQLDGKFSLGDFKGGNKIPFANKFILNNIKFSPSGLEAKTLLANVNVNAFLFEMNGGSNFVLEQEKFSFPSLLKGTSNIPLLNKISLSNVGFIFSEKGMKLQAGKLPSITQDMMDDMFKGVSSEVNVPKGISLLSKFSPSSFGIIGKGLSGLGVGDNSILMGELKGIFEGENSFNLSIIMDKRNKSSALPTKVLFLPEDAIAHYFISFNNKEVRAGIDIGMKVHVGDDKLLFDTEVELDFTPKGIGASILGEMHGTWHKPFGIEGINLSDVTMQVGISEIGEVKLGFKGTEEIGKEKITLASEIDILLEDGLPDGVAFLGTINVLGIPAISDIVSTLTHTPNVLENVKVPFFEIHDAKLAFASPGVVNEKLGLTGDGFAFKGDFFFLGRVLGKVDGSGGTKGLKINGAIEDFDVSLVKFKNNHLKMKMGLNSSFELDSSIEIAHIKQDVKVDFSPPHIAFDIVEDFGEFGKADLKVSLEGMDLASGKVGQDLDVSIVGILKSNLVPFLKKEIVAGLNKTTAAATEKLKDLEKTLKKAQAEVDKIDKIIQNVKARDKRSKDRALNGVHAAERKVNKLKRTLHHQNNKASNCGNSWTHWACKGYWKVRAAGTYVAYKVAKNVLYAVKKTVAAAFSLDPELIALEGTKQIATGILMTAKAGVKVAEAAEEFVLHELTKAVKTAINNLPFEIEEVIILGDLKDSIQNDAPLILDMKFKLFQKEYREYFAIKLKDQKFNAASFALLPAIALDKATQKILSKLDPKVADWFHSHIAIALANAEAKVRKEVETIEHKYAKVLKSYESGSVKFKQAYSKVDERKEDIIEAFTMTDLMPKSLHYKNTYLAVGHSSLCLGVATNNTDVFQENCKNIDAEKWTTKDLGNGYVQLKNSGLCLKARTKKNSGSDPLIMASCNKSDIHEQWKIVSTDGFYDMIVNKFSQKCLHFESENANEKTAYAVWTSCIGADSQNFRDIQDTQRPTFHGVKDEIKAKNNRCLSTNEKFDSYFHKEGKYGHLDSTPQKLSLMRNKKDNLLFSKKCLNNKEDERFSFIEEVNGDIKLIHAETGWCVSPKHNKENQLILNPCDKGKDLLWRNNLGKNSFFEMQNIKLKKCISLENDNKNKTSYAFLKHCKKEDQQLIKFVKN